MIFLSIQIYLYRQYASKFITSWKCHSRDDIFDTLKYRSKAHNNVRRYYNKYIFLCCLWNTLAFLISGDKVAAGHMRLSVRYNQMSVHMNVRISCSFIYACERRHAVVDVRSYRTKYTVGTSDRHFSISVGICHPRIFLAFHHLLIGFALCLDSAHCDSGTTKSNGKYLLAKYRNIF